MDKAAVNLKLDSIEYCQHHLGTWQKLLRNAKRAGDEREIKEAEASIAYYSMLILGATEPEAHAQYKEMMK